MPEYPETSPDGVLYCVNVQGVDQHIVKKMHETVYTD